MTTVANQPSVGTTDELAKAIKAAKARIAQVQENASKTLIENIPAQEWANWDASGEMALVADKHGLEDDHALDDDEACSEEAA